MINPEDASEDQVYESLMCSTLCSSQAVITRDLVNGGNMQSDRRVFFPRLRCLSQWQRRSVLREQPLYSRSLSQPFPHSSVSCQPTRHAQSPRHLAERHLLLWTLLNPSITRLALKDPLFHYFAYLCVWNARRPLIRNPLPHQICFILCF